MSKRKVLVVGAGASGLMAAGMAAESGAEVILLEKTKMPARKIRISGKGRCNLSNSAELPDFLNHFTSSGRFLRQVFNRFFTAELVDFFESKGLPMNVERGGRIFPAAGNALDVAALLVDWNKRVGVTIRTGQMVTGLNIVDNQVRGLFVGKRELSADTVILAMGGASYPRTGSTGDGYRLAEAVGHHLVPIRPALVPLKIKSEIAKTLCGLKLKNIVCRLIIGSKRKRKDFGELYFIRSGLSGPIVLTQSLEAVDALRAGKRVMVSIDLKPALDDTKLKARLLRDLESRCREPMKQVLRGLLPQQLVPFCLEQNGIDPEQAADKLSAGTRRKLGTWLKDFRIAVTGYCSFDEAIVTAGGVKTAEVDPRTMASKVIKSLYLAGEMIDIQADTGGYNLQAAFSTGWLAGLSAARGMG